jgi:hypothetical protein
LIQRYLASPEPEGIGLKWRLLKQAEKQHWNDFSGATSFSHLQVVPLQPERFSVWRDKHC